MCCARGSDTGEVGFFVEDGAAAIAPVEDVVAVAAQSIACAAWHPLLLAHPPLLVKIIHPVPFSFQEDLY